MEYVGEIILSSGVCCLIYNSHLTQKFVNQITEDIVANSGTVVIHGTVNGNVAQYVGKDMNYNMLFVKISGIEIVYEHPSHYLTTNNYVVPTGVIQKSSTCTKLLTFHTDGTNVKNEMLLSQKCYKHQTLFNYQGIKKILDTLKIDVPLCGDTPYDYYKFEYAPYIDKSLIIYEYNKKKFVAEQVNDIVDDCCNERSSNDSLNKIGLTVIGIGSLICAIKSMNNNNPTSYFSYLVVSSCSFLGCLGLILTE